MSSLALCTSPVVGGTLSNMVTSMLQVLVASHCALTAPSVWPTDYGPTALTDGLEPYHFIVVGAGASGSVVASRLSENSRYRVLVIEAGDDPPTESEIPALSFTTHRGEHTFNYYTEPNPRACQGTTTETCYWPVAKTMGGLSSIYPPINFRGNRKTVDDWNLPNWSWQEVSRYYDLAERYENPASSPVGRLVVNNFDQYDTCNVNDMIFNGANELGARRLLPNVIDSSKVGYGFLKGHLENGQRMEAGKTYLSAARSRPNLHVIKNAEVIKINFDPSQSVTSVRFIIGQDQMEVDVLNEVILAAGVLGNPKILMLSGIGPQAHLENFGIPVVSNLPGVGQNLRDQVIAPIPFQHNKSKAKPKTVKDTQIDLFYYLMEKYGPLSTVGTSAIVGLINSNTTCGFTNCRYPDLNIYHIFSQRNSNALKSWYEAVGYKSSISQSIADANKDANLLFSFVALNNPQSVGHVELQSDSYLDNLKVFADYFEEQSDVESILQGIKFQMELEQTKAYKKDKTEIIKLNIPECDEFTFKSDDYWRCYIKFMGTTVYIRGGTTKMGINTDTSSVVDTTLNVRGVRRLKIVGQSVLPTVIAATNPSVMIGEKLAATLKQDWA